MVHFSAIFAYPQQTFRTSPRPLVPGLRFPFLFLDPIVFLHLPFESFFFPAPQDFDPDIMPLLSPNPAVHLASGCFSDGNFTPSFSLQVGTVIQASLY